MPKQNTTATEESERYRHQPPHLHSKTKETKKLLLGVCRNEPIRNRGKLKTPLGSCRSKTQLLRKKVNATGTNRLTFIVRYNNKQRNASQAISSLYKHLHPLFTEYNSRLPNPLPLEAPRIAYSSNRRLGDGLGKQFKQGPRMG